MHSQAQSVFANPLDEFALIGLVWAYIHHFCAGIRLLLLDLDKGTDLDPARQSSVVLGVSIALTLIVAARIW